MASVADRGQVVLITAVLVAVGLLLAGVVLGQLVYDGGETRTPDPMTDVQNAVSHAVDQTGESATPQPTRNQTVEAWTTTFDSYVTTIERQTPGAVTVQRNQTAAAAAAEAQDTVTAVNGVLVEHRGDVVVVVGVVVDIEIVTENYDARTTEQIPTRPRIEPTPTTTVILPGSLPGLNGTGLHEM